MMPAAKHFDPVLGVDIHIIQPPGPVPPIPIPHPFIGFLFDPFDYVPIIGATVIINGVPRAIAGTMGRTIPGLHFPIGGSFIKPPANECEMFMGSTTVDFDGDAASYMVLPALSCQCIGMIAPFRRKKKGKMKSLVAPFSVVLPIPIGLPVVIGGPPTISLMAVAMKLGLSALGRALKKVSKAKAFRKVKDKFKRKKPSTNKACGRPGEPVDVVTGANVDSFLDYELSGPIPIVWKRYYDSSQAPLDGPLGRGFRHEYQRVLQKNGDVFEYVTQEGETIEFPAPMDGDSVANDGFVLRHTGANTYRIEHFAQPSMNFVVPDDGSPGRLSSLRHGEHWIRFDYEGNGSLFAIRDSSGHYIAVSNDAAGHISSLQLLETGEASWQTIAQYGYDAFGNLVGWRDALGHTAYYWFDTPGRMIRKSDRRGYSFHYEYDAQNRCVHTFGDDGLYDLRLEYLGVERCTIVTWADGARYEYFYDEDAILTRIVDPYGGSRVFVADEEGRVQEDIHPSGAVTKLMYNEAGAHTSRVDALGYLSSPLDVDPNPPNPLEQGMGNTPQEWEFGSLFKRLTPRAHPINTFPEPRSIEVRDLMGRVVEQIDNLGNRELYSRDASGNLIGRRDKDGSVWENQFTSWNLLSRAIDPLGYATSYGYSLREEIISITDAGGSVSEYEYDLKDRLIAVRRDGIVREHYAYNSHDDLIRKLDRNGELLVMYEADENGLVTECRSKSGDVRKFSYNETGQYTNAVTPDIEVTQQWDGATCIEDLQNGMGVRAQFHENSRSLTVLDKFTTTYHLADGELSITDPAGGVHRLQLESSVVLQRRFSNGLSETVEYSASGRCVRKTLVDAVHFDNWERRYKHSGEDDLLEVRDSVRGVTTYQYDKAHRLILESAADIGDRAFKYDSAGNLIHQPGLHDVVIGGGNRITFANGDRFEYNLRNHLSRRTGPTTTLEFEYDAYDDLRGVRGSHGEWSAQYDALGRRVAAQGATGARIFYWQDDRLAAEVLASGEFRIYVYTDEIALAPFAFVQYESVDSDPAEGKRYVIITNQIGAPVEVRDDSSAVVWAAEIDPYGTAHIRPGNSIELNLRWPGHYFDAETGLHYNRFRYYSPELGRYLESDPAGQSGGINLYAYPPSPLAVVDLQGLHSGQSKGGRAANQKAKPKAETPTVKAKAKAKAKRYKDGSIRTPDGKFAGKTGVVPGTPGVEKAERVINKRPGWRVKGKEISVRDGDGTLRRYDLVAQNPKGKMVGVEVKSGTATRNKQQRTVDKNLTDEGGLPTVGKRAEDAGIEQIDEVEVLPVP